MLAMKMFNGSFPGRNYDAFVGFAWLVMTREGEAPAEPFTPLARQEPRPPLGFKGLGIAKMPVSQWSQFDGFLSFFEIMKFFRGYWRAAPKWVMLSSRMTFSVSVSKRSPTGRSQDERELYVGL